MHVGLFYESNFIMNRNDFFYWLQSILGAHPSLYYPVFARKYPFNQMAVTRETQICIEGFPRSANSYTVVAFRLANPNVKIAHHLHVPAQLIRAAQQGIPAVLLVRDPLEAVASFLVFQNSSDADLYLQTYIRFHRHLRNLADSFVVADFLTATQNVNAIVRALNRKFSTKFKELELNEENHRRIFVRLKEVNEQFFPGQANKAMYPDKARAKAKERALKLVEQSDRLAVARDVYRWWQERSV
jgi:hypothetical protein